MFACARIGAVHVPVNTRLRTADLEYVLRQSNATTLLTHDVSGPVDYLAMAREVIGDLGRPRLPDMEHLVITSERQHPGTWSWTALIEAGGQVSDATLQARADAVKATDTMLIMYTSGTTGFPKGVARDHGLIESLIDRQHRLGMSEHDVFINYLPLFHVFGYCDGPLASVMVGSRQVLTESFDAAEALD